MPSKENVLSPPPEETPTTTSSDTTQSSPDHQGDSLTKPLVNKGGESPTPIAPPRRKRKTKRMKSEAQKAQASPMRVNVSHVQSHDSTKHNGAVKSPTDDFVDLESPFLEDLVRQNSTVGSHKSDASLAVMGSSRPHSVVTPYQSKEFGFADEDRGSTAYSSMPRVLATTWSPRSELLERRKTAVTASSEWGVFSCTYSVYRLDSADATCGWLVHLSIHAYTHTPHSLHTSHSFHTLTHTHTARYALSVAFPLYSVRTVTKLQSVNLKEQGLKLPEGLLILFRNSHSLKLHVHSHNTYDAESLRELLDKTFVLRKVSSGFCKNRSLCSYGFLVNYYQNNL